MRPTKKQTQRLPKDTIVFVVASGDIDGGRVRCVCRDRGFALLVARKLAHREWAESRHCGRPCFRRKRDMRFMLRRVMRSDVPWALKQTNPLLLTATDVEGFVETYRSSREADDGWYSWWLVREWRVV